jgi:hypothetical protein
MTIFHLATALVFSLVPDKMGFQAKYPNLEIGLPRKQLLEASLETFSVQVTAINCLTTFVVRERPVWHFFLG